MISQSSIYSFLLGPAFIFSECVFIFGLLGKAIWYISGLSYKNDQIAYPKIGHKKFGAALKGALSSIFIWFIPFKNSSNFIQKITTIASICFHLGFIGVAILLPAHTEIRTNIFGWSLGTDLTFKFGSELIFKVAHVLAIMSLSGLILLIGRRILIVELRFLTGWREAFPLILCFFILISGLVANVTVYEESKLWLKICHVLAGEILLICIPFTNLSHMMLFFLSRAQIGIDYAIKRGGKKRGARFPL